MRFAVRLSIAMLWLAAGSTAARAGCMPAPTAQAQALVDRAGRDPGLVIAETAATRMTAGDVATAWRLAARAEAYDLLSLPLDARRIGLETLRQLPAPPPQIQAELLHRVAVNSYRNRDIDALLPTLIAARRAQTPGSASEVCLRIAQGEMERLRGLLDRATVNLTQAYAASSISGREPQRVAAAEGLAKVMNTGGDTAQAMSLIDEVIDWDRARGKSFRLSNDLYWRGMFLTRQGDYRAALGAFARAREASAATTDPSGNAYVDLQTCRILIELGRLAPAARLCLRAEGAFRRLADDAQGQASLYLARIAAAQGRHRAALARLDGLLASESALSASVERATAFRLRAQTNAALGRADAAFRDLSTYLRVSEAAQSVQRDKQLAVQRARFAADRAAARNRQLNAELAFARDQERERSQRDRMLLAAGVLGLLLIVTIALMGWNHRRRLTVLANSDTLTGLLNRRAIAEKADVLVRANLRTPERLALAIVDLDHFKAVNDAYGHGTGDRVLARFGEVATATLRTGDLVGRWGGEEFILVLPGTTTDEALMAIERLRERLRREHFAPGANLTVEFSAGLAVLAPDDGFDTLVTRADDALYEAKRAGRNRTVIARHEMPPPISPKADRVPARGG